MKYESKDATNIIVVITTTDSREEAQRIARAMVEKRLAACAQVSGPIESHFHWDNRIDRAEEWQCKFKTAQGKYPELERAIVEMHSYEVPQVVAFPVTMAFKAFAQWVYEETVKKTA